MVIAAYEAGCRVFGENYVDELIDKCKDRDLQDKCKDIQWHFIGHLQRNKVKKLVRVPNLHMIETIDSKKLASEVQKAWANLEKSRVEKLNVMVQVNTSREAGFYFIICTVRHYPICEFCVSEKFIFFAIYRKERLLDRRNSGPGKACYRQLSKFSIFWAHDYRCVWLRHG